MTTTTPTVSAHQLAFRLLAVLAVVLIAAAGLIGFLPTSAYGVNCGSAFAPSRDADVADISDTFAGYAPRTGTVGGVADACSDGHSTRRTFAIVVLVAAAGASVAAGVSRGAATRR
jgi:hypothetical protein